MTQLLVVLTALVLSIGPKLENGYIDFTTNVNPANGGDFSCRADTGLCAFWKVATGTVRTIADTVEVAAASAVGAAAQVTADAAAAAVIVAQAAADAAQADADSHAARHLTAGGDTIASATNLAAGLATAAQITSLEGIPATVTAAQAAAEAASVPRALYDADSLVCAAVDNTPIVLPVGLSTFVGRKAAGSIAAMSTTEARTLLNVADGADVTADNAPQAHAASHVAGDLIQNATAIQSGLATSTQITKLDGIEASADVTDATNVSAAGACMTGGCAFTGAVTTNSTWDGVAVATRDAVLTTTTTTANAAMPASGGNFSDDVTMTALKTFDGVDVSVFAASVPLDSEMLCTSGFVGVTSAGVYNCRQNNMAAATAPTATDDVDPGGYSVGSVWLDTTLDLAYVCLDATDGAAVWRRADSTGALYTSVGGTMTAALTTAGRTVARRTIPTDCASPCTALASDEMLICVGAANCTVALPNATAGARYVIHNATTAHVVTVTPDTGDTINGGAVDASLTLPTPQASTTLYGGTTGWSAQTTAAGGTTNASYGIDYDATGAVDTDPVLICTGGEGAGAELISTRLQQDSSANLAYLYTSSSTAAANTADKTTNFTIGPPALSAFDADAVLTLRGQTVAGVEKAATITVDASAATTTFTGAGALTVQASGAASLLMAAAGSSQWRITGAGAGLIDVGSASTLSFTKGAAAGIVLDHGTTDELDLNAYGIRQDDGATHCWGSAGTSDGCVSMDAGNDWLFDHVATTGGMTLRTGTDTTSTAVCLVNDSGAEGLCVDGTGATISDGARFFRPPDTLTTTPNSDVTATSRHHVVICDPPGENQTINLPAATGTGRELYFTNGDLGAFTVTLDGNASEKINGATTYLLATSGEYVWIVDAMSGGWIVTGND